MNVLLTLCARSEILGDSSTFPLTHQLSRSCQHTSKNPQESQRIPKNLYSAIIQLFLECFRHPLLKESSKNLQRAHMISMYVIQTYTLVHTRTHPCRHTHTHTWNLQILGPQLVTHQMVRRKLMIIIVKFIFYLCPHYHQLDSARTDKRIHFYQINKPINSFRCECECECDFDQYFKCHLISMIGFQSLE